MAVSAKEAATQAPDSALSAANAISASEIARHVGVIAHDSMLGRDTPSRGLDLTARYLIDQFKRLGLRPGGDATPKVDSLGRAITVPVKLSNGTSYDQPVMDTSWFMRYTIPGKATFSPAASTLTFSTTIGRSGAAVLDDRGDPVQREMMVDFATNARYVGDTVPESGARGDFAGVVTPTTVVIAGPHTPATIRQAKLRSHIIFYVPAPHADSATQREIVDLLGTSNNVVILSPEDSATFASNTERAAKRHVLVVDQFLEKALGARQWKVVVRPQAIEKLLVAAGIDLAAARTAPTPVIQERPLTSASFQPGLGKNDTTTAANVVAILDGTNPPITRGGIFGPYESKDYLIVTAHMDHRGVTRGSADSIRNGADDNASGVAGLIELAKAFSQAGGRPGRGIIFVGLSGSAKGFWGSTLWSRELNMRSIVAGVNLDMIGHAPGDSVWVDGLPDLEFAVRPDWVATRHPEARLTLVDGGSAANTKSDHAAFVRRGLPTLYFYSGSHERVADNDAPSSVDAEAEARILRLVYHITREISKTDRLPKWTSAGRERRIEVFGE